MSKLLTKQSGREISQNTLRSAEAESNFKNTFTKVSLDSVNAAVNLNKALELVKKFSQENKARVDYGTIFKMYMLQNYKLDMEYFKGTKYLFGTLKQQKSIVKHIYKNGKSWDTKRGDASIYITDFVNQLKEIIQPFRLHETAHRGSITELVSSNLICEAEKKFITDPVTTSSKFYTPSKITFKSSSNKGKRYGKELIANDTLLEFASCFQLKCEQLLEKFDLKKGTVQAYKSFFTRLSKGEKPTGCPGKVVEAWNTYNKTKTSSKSVSSPKVVEKVVSNPITNVRYGILDTESNSVIASSEDRSFAEGCKATLDLMTSRNLINSSCSKTPLKIIEFKFL